MVARIQRTRAHTHTQPDGASRQVFLRTIARGIYYTYTHTHTLTHSYTRTYTYTNYTFTYTNRICSFEGKKWFARNLNDVINGAECKRESLPTRCLGVAVIP